jgi:hypothetical protein
MNFDRLRFVAERAEIGEQREAVLAVTIPEQPRQLPQASAKSSAGRSVTEFNYRYADSETAHVFVGRRGPERGTRGGPPLAHDSTEAGYPALDLTDNEIAKLHLRHMVGGRTPRARRRECCSASSSPSARARCSVSSNAMAPGWNISALPLPQPGLGRRPRAGRHAGAARATARRSPPSARPSATGRGTRPTTRRTSCSCADAVAATPRPARAPGRALRRTRLRAGAPGGATTSTGRVANGRVRRPGHLGASALHVSGQAPGQLGGRRPEQPVGRQEHRRGVLPR